MKILVLCCLLVALPLCAVDLTPKIGDIEVFGAHKTPLKKIRATLGVSEGSPLPDLRSDVEDRLNHLPGVVGARVQAECCDQGKTTVYVGLQERDMPHFAFRPPPTAAVTLPEEVQNHYQTFLDAVSVTYKSRHADEDLTNGYSLMSDPDCRDQQEYFRTFAAEHADVLDNVLRNAIDPEQRRTAAYLIQYGLRGPRNTPTVVNALQYALNDTDDSVRRIALRSLTAVAVGGRLHPDQQVQIEPTWFIELMNSVVWSDRHAASLALVDLTQETNPEAMSLIRERALQSVVEMARWHNLAHALPGFILAGRLAGLSESQIKRAWVSADHEPVLQRALHPNSKRTALDL